MRIPSWRRRRLRVALAYFGLTRSLRHTAASIACNIEAPLAESGAEVRRVGHFHRPAVIDNPRSGERGVVPDSDDTPLLGLDAVTTEPQDAALVTADWEICRNGRDVFDDGYRSLQNLCFQLRSLRQVWRLASPGLQPGDWVLFLRPDLRYLDRIDFGSVAHALERDGCALAVPRWQNWGGLNDRFALCRADVAEAYAGRAEHLGAMIDCFGAVHPESLLAYAVNAAGLRPGFLDTRAVRIRADGRPAPQDVAWFNEMADTMA